MSLQHGEILDSFASREEYGDRRRVLEKGMELMDAMRDVDIDEVLGICKQRKMEKQLIESEKKFRMLAEQSPNMIFINKMGKIVYANQKCEELMEYKKEEFYSPDFEFLKLVAPESRSLVEKRYESHIKGKDVEPYEYALISKNGQRIEAIITTNMIEFQGESAILGIITDITARKEMEKKLFESEQKFRSLVENSAVSICTTDKKGRLTYVNEAMANLFGYSIEEMLNHSFKEFLYPEDRNRVLRLFFNIMILKRQPRNLEFRIIRKDGQVRHLLSRPIKFIIDGKIVGFQAIILDITDRILSEKKIIESENQFQTLFYSLPDPIAIVDVNGKILSINDEVIKLTDFKKEKLIGKNFKDLKIFTKKSKLYLAKNLAKRMRGKKIAPYEVKVVTKVGEEIWMEVNATKIDYQGEPADIVIFRNINDRKQIEVELGKYAERIKELVNDRTQEITNAKK
jgi:PAS domain S-box-containing protein